MENILFSFADTPDSEVSTPTSSIVISNQFVSALDTNNPPQALLANANNPSPLKMAAHGLVKRTAQESRDSGCYASSETLPPGDTLLRHSIVSSITGEIRTRASVPVGHGHISQLMVQRQSIAGRTTVAVTPGLIVTPGGSTLMSSAGSSLDRLVESSVATQLENSPKSSPRSSFHERSPAHTPHNSPLGSPRHTAQSPLISPRTSQSPIVSSRTTESPPVSPRLSHQDNPVSVASVVSKIQTDTISPAHSGHQLNDIPRANSYLDSPQSSPRSILRHRELSPVVNGRRLIQSVSPSSSPIRGHSPIASSVRGSSPHSSPNRNTFVLGGSPLGGSPTIRSPMGSPIRIRSPRESPPKAPSPMGSPQRIRGGPPPIPKRVKPQVPERTSSLARQRIYIGVSNGPSWASNVDYANLLPDSELEGLLNGRRLSGSQPQESQSTPNSPQRSKLPTPASARVSRHESLLAKRKPRPMSVSVESLLVAKLESEDIDLTEPPYTDKVRFFIM